MLRRFFVPGLLALSMIFVRLESRNLCNSEACCKSCCLDQEFPQGEYDEGSVYASDNSCRFNCNDSLNCNDRKEHHAGCLAGEAFGDSTQGTSFLFDDETPMCCLDNGDLLANDAVLTEPNCGFTKAPTGKPTSKPTQSPTAKPTHSPTTRPTGSPTFTATKSNPEDLIMTGALSAVMILLLIGIFISVNSLKVKEKQLLDQKLALAMKEYLY